MVDSSHPSVKDISNPLFTPKSIRHPVTTVRVSPEDARVNDDGSLSEVLPDGCIKRRVRMPSGNVKTQYLTPDLYVISSYRGYKESLKRTKELLLEQSDEQSMSPVLDQDVAPVPQTVVGRHESVPPMEERVDEVTDRVIRKREMLDMSEAFPDIGMSNSDGSPIASPAIRARQAAIHGTRYQKEYILRTVHRLTLRRVPTDEIARMFNVQVVTVYKWLDELNKRLKQEANAITLNHIAGDTLAFYAEVRSLGLTTATTSDKVAEKVRGMEVALRAEQDKHKFLQVAGFYDTAKLGRDQQEDEAGRKATKLIEMTQNLLNGTFEATDEDELEESDEDNIII